MSHHVVSCSHAESLRAPVHFGYMSTHQWNPDSLSFRSVSIRLSTSDPVRFPSGYQHIYTKYIYTSKQPQTVHMRDMILKARYYIVLRNGINEPTILSKINLQQLAGSRAEGSTTCLFWAVVIPRWSPIVHPQICRSRWRVALMLYRMSAVLRISTLCYYRLPIPRMMGPNG